MNVHVYQSHVVDPESHWKRITNTELKHTLRGADYVKGGRFEDKSDMKGTKKDEKITNSV